MTNEGNSKMEISKINQAMAEIEKVIVGKRDVVEMLMVALLTEGHVLIEDVPGVGKTTLATALGKSTGLVCKRAQFTPDVMASDITGFTMYNKEMNKFEYRHGLVMTNILLADEINRTTPKTQSALLEAMEEKQVSVDGTVHSLPNPFMVIATQNCHGYVGTFALPEAQLDRFFFKLSIGYPSVEEEVSIIADRQLKNPVQLVNPVLTREEVVAHIQSVKKVVVDKNIMKYIVALVSSTRNESMVTLGASPRASLALMRAAQGYAYINGRGFIVPEDVIRVISAVLSHRIILSQEAKVKKITVNSILRKIVTSIAPPYRGQANV